MRNTQATTQLKPLTARLEAVDALRGFALLGVLLANLPIAQEPLITLPTDEVVGFLYYLLIGKKFMTIFSILFGFGFYIQFKKAQEKGVNFVPYFLKRMGLLFLIGTIHAWLIWNGDILRAYAVGGVFLLLVRNWSTRNLVVLGITFAVILAGISFIAPGALGLSHNYDYSLLTEVNTTESLLRYLEINFVTDPWMNFAVDMPLTLCFAFGNMVLGVVLGRIGFFQLSKQTRTLRRWSTIIGSTLGLVASYYFYLVFTGQMSLDIPQLWMPFAIIAGMLFQSLFYMSVFVWFYYKSAPWILRVFVPVGKTALTNYLAQSILFLLVFYHCTGWPALYGKIGVTATFSLGIVFFALQIAVSYLWLKKFRQGPVEYLWKTLAYRGYKNTPKQNLKPLTSES